jgi:hypothetical protein
MDLNIKPFQRRRKGGAADEEEEVAIVNLNSEGTVPSIVAPAAVSYFVRLSPFFLLYHFSYRTVCKSTIPGLPLLLSSFLSIHFSHPLQLLTLL